MPKGDTYAGAAVPWRCGFDGDAESAADEIFDVPSLFEITVFAKAVGVMTKVISLSEDGKFRSNSSLCRMWSGTAHRLPLDSLKQFADDIENLPINQAYALGALRLGLAEDVVVTTKHRLSAGDKRIARTRESVNYRPDQAALMLIDVDTKSMPEPVQKRVDELGGLELALISVMPKLATSGRIVRASTSAGISTDTGEMMPGSGGLHIYVPVKDGADIERTLRTLHERCWRAGFGWMMLGAVGQLLDRSLIDPSVRAAERLVFEAGPVLAGRLVQNAEARRPQVIEGSLLDTAVACRPLTVVEQAEITKLRAKERQRLAPAQAVARAAFIDRRSVSLKKRSPNMSIEAARRTVESWADGVLLSDIILPFDDPDLAGRTVDDVLADPDFFVGASMADPLEGPPYGFGKAMVLRRSDGTIFINSFAHGGMTYELRHGVGRIEAILKTTPDAEAVNVFVNLVVDADIDDHDRHRLRDAISKRTNTGVRIIDQMITKAIGDRAAKRKEGARERASAERTDRRPQILVPLPDAPWNPVVDAINEVLGGSMADEPPMVNVEGCITQIRGRRIVNMHTLTVAGANSEEAKETRLPPPEQTLLTTADNPAVAGLIEDNIDYIKVTDDEVRSVHLPMHFVNHYRSTQPSSGALPVVAAVATLPIVLPNATILSGPGLVRDRGIVFRVPDELRALIPSVAECTPDAICAAMNFLTDDWLADVATDYRGKCTLTTAAMSIIERTELPMRVAYSITAGQAASGKTTTINMASVGVLGILAAAAAWSQNPEERRKAIFACLSAGPALVVWDNIPNGTSFSCPTIEASLTSAKISDRVLGETDWRTVPATTIHVFTGNNIYPKGDLASRTLSIRLNVDQLDPENRPFNHADPIAWTLKNRGAILRALYIVMLGNPRLRDGSNLASADTRFKEWHRLIGSAVENGAKLCAGRDEKASAISFKDMFFKIRADEEQGTSRGALLTALSATWPKGFSSSELSDYLDEYGSSTNNDDDACKVRIELRAALAQATGGIVKSTASSALTWKLKTVVDAPVGVDGKILVLRFHPDPERAGYFQVEEIGGL